MPSSITPCFQENWLQLIVILDIMCQTTTVPTDSNCKSEVLMTEPSTNRGEYAANMSRARKIFAEYGDFIYGVIRSKVKNDVRADDLYQNFFLSLVSDPISADMQNIKSYLYRAIINDIYDDTRKMQRYAKLRKKYADHLYFSIKKNTLRNASIIEERIDKILNCVGGKLPSNELEAIILRYRKSCSADEIAEKMSIKKESVSRYICVGLKRIRQLLGAKQSK